MKSNRLSWIGAAMALFGCAEVGQVLDTAVSQATTPPIFFENFEAPITNNYTVYHAGQSFTTQRNTWQVTAASVDIANATARHELVAGDGTQMVDLAGSPGAGVISTSFPTTPGQRYTLTFQYGRNNGIGAVAARARVEVIGTTTLLHADLQHKAPTPFNSLQYFNMAFVADSPSTTLRFSGLTEGVHGVTIDAIAVRGAAQTRSALRDPRHAGG